jgi:hypothetical protein
VVPERHRPLFPKIFNKRIIMEKIEYEVVFEDGKSVVVEMDETDTEFDIICEAEGEYEYNFCPSPFDDGWAFDHFEFPKVKSIHKTE